MASYLGFHGSSDAMPHQFPPMAQTHVWQKGVLGGLSSIGNTCSDYNTGIDELELSQFSELVDNQDLDIVPSAHPPASFHQWRSAQTPELCAPDPDLGLTPEKGVTFTRGNFRSEVKEKTGRKVRFDIESSSESELEKSPLATANSCPQTATSDSHSDSHTLNKQVTNNDETGSHAEVYTYSVKHPPDANVEYNEVTDIDSAVSGVRKKKNGKLKGVLDMPQREDRTIIPGDLCDSSTITREQEEIPVVIEYNFPFKDGTEQETGILLSSAFERPEYNSTLRLGNELKDLSSQKLDVVKAVKKTLKKSEALRTDINEKAASRVNTQGDVFQGLATLDVPIGDIISQVEQNQRSKVKTSGIKHKKDPKAKELKEPDLMEFFNADLQKENVDLTVTGVNFPKETLSLASHEKAFDMYKHNLAWQEFD